MTFAIHNTWPLRLLRDAIHKYFLSKHDTSFRISNSSRHGGLPKVGFLPFLRRAEPVLLRRVLLLSCRETEDDRLRRDNGRVTRLQVTPTSGRFRWRLLKSDLGPPAEPRGGRCVGRPLSEPPRGQRRRRRRRRVEMSPVQ